MPRRAGDQPGCGRRAAGGLWSRLLRQVVRVAGVQGQPVDGLELLNLGEGGRAERWLAFEGVQDDALDEIAKRQVEVLGETLENLQGGALNAEAGLHSLYCYHGNKITLGGVPGADADRGTLADLSLCNSPKNPRASV